MKKADFKYTAMALILSIVFSIINFNAYLKGSMPNIYNAAFSIIFISIWFVSSLVMSHKNIVGFLRFCTIYWAIGTVLTIISTLTNLVNISMLTFVIFGGPTYGLRYFIKIRADIKLTIICIIISYAFSIIGYLLGKITRKK